jgi:predicted nucleic acid-binding protein
LSQFLPLFLSVSFDDKAAEIFGRIRADVTARGVTLGPYDLQIAATSPRCFVLAIAVLTELRLICEGSGPGT